MELQLSNYHVTACGTLEADFGDKSLVVDRILSALELGHPANWMLYDSAYKQEDVYSVICKDVLKRTPTCIILANLVFDGEMAVNR